MIDLFSEGFRVQLIRELPEFVEIDTRPETKGMGNRFRRGMAPSCRGLADARANCPTHRFLCLERLPSTRLVPISEFKLRQP